jgi:hypothetical protein
MHDDPGDRSDAGRRRRGGVIGLERWRGVLAQGQIRTMRDEPLTVAEADRPAVPGSRSHAAGRRGGPWWRWVVWSGIAVAVALRAFFHSPLAVAEQPSAIAEQYVWLGAAAAAGLVVLARIRQRPTAIGWPDVLAASLAAPLIAWWVLDRGMVHIGGYDHSALVNYGWLQQVGMRPHVDFPCTLCPHFYLGIKYAFAWFGVAWRSAVLLGAIYAAVSFVWSYYLLRTLDLPRLRAGLVALLAQSMCLMMSGYFWYNSVGTTDLIILFLSALAWVDRPRSVALFASVTAALALVLLDKPNGWMLPACLAIGLFGSGGHRWRFPACLLAALGVIAMVAWLGPFDPAATLRMYVRLGKSRTPGIEPILHSLHFDNWHGPFETGKLSVFVATFLTAAPVCLWTHRAEWRTAGGRAWARLWVYAGALATGAAFFFTNHEPKCTDMALPAVALAVWLAKLECREGPGYELTPGQVGLTCAIWLGVFAFCQGRITGRVHLLDFEMRASELAVPALAFMAWAVRYEPWGGISGGAQKWVYAAAAVTAGALLYSGYVPRWTDLAVVAVAVAAKVVGREPWSALRFTGDPRRAAAAFGVWLCLFSLGQGLVNGWNRYRVFYVCPDEFWQREVSGEPPATAFLAGVRGSPRLVRVMRDLDAAVQKHPDGEIFFGPCIEFAYAAFGRTPPTGFPVWWHPGTSYFPADAARAVNAFRTRQFDTLIFLDKKFHQMPPEIEHRLREWYDIEDESGTVTVYRRKLTSRIVPNSVRQ